MNVVIIGTGNVATVLCKLIQSKKHKLVEIVGRNQNDAFALANYCNAKANTNFEKITPNADIYIVAVSDSAIEEVLMKMDFSNKLIIHTAGSVSINLLQKYAESYGVLWPLQTLRREMGYIPAIPMIIDANNDQAYSMLLSFAKSISDTVFRANDAKRVKLHLSAVLVSNFTNHLYSLADEYCHNELLEFQLLIPLIEETSNRIKHHVPNKVQTGPAIRKDELTINTHLSLLKNYPSLHKIYSILTESIKRNKKIKEN